MAAMIEVEALVKRFGSTQAPAGFHGFASHQPVSITIDAVRALLQGQPTHNWVWQSLAWSVGTLVVFFVIAVALYRGVTS
jgi:hypothetical protein